MDVHTAPGARRAAGQGLTVLATGKLSPQPKAAGPGASGNDSQVSEDRTALSREKTLGVHRTEKP